MRMTTLLSIAGAVALAAASAASAQVPPSGPTPGAPSAVPRSQDVAASNRQIDNDYNTLAGRGVKVQDLLTNRYHAGVLVERSDSVIEIELSHLCRVQAGQRLRFIVADDRALVSRDAMRTAEVMLVRHGITGTRVCLSIRSEPAAA